MSVIFSVDFYQEKKISVFKNNSELPLKNWDLGRSSKSQGKILLSVDAVEATSE